jgi:hypothetical protein
MLWKKFTPCFFVNLFVMNDTFCSAVHQWPQRKRRGMVCYQCYAGRSCHTGRMGRLWLWNCSVQVMANRGLVCTSYTSDAVVTPCRIGILRLWNCSVQVKGKPQNGLLILKHGTELAYQENEEIATMKLFSAGKRQTADWCATRVTRDRVVIPGE